MDRTYQSQKVELSNEDYDVLFEEIEFNNNRVLNLEDSKSKVDRNNRIIEKLNKYKKTSENGIYYYFFIRELKDLFIIILENIQYKNNM